MIDITSLLSKNVKKHLLSLPISHQKEWMSYINEAKKEETRLKRVLKMHLSFYEKYKLEGDTQIISLLEQIVNSTPEKANAVGDAFLNTIGNNHSGVYYVEYKWAIDFLVQLYKNSDPSTPRAIVVHGILNDLYYFEPIEKHPTNTDLSALKTELEQILAPFSDKE